MDKLLLADCLSQSALQHADRIAVLSKNKSITYAELDQLTSKIAASLRAAGIAPLSRVGIFIDKSIEAVAAIFGILKAGCAYVPIDPKAPQERVRYILQNCRLDSILTEQNKLNKIIALCEDVPHLKNIFNLSDTAGENTPDIPDCLNYIRLQDILSESAVSPSLEGVTINDPAYILYTSGSTGDPKGVVLSHKNALVFIEWAIGYFNICENDIVSSHAPFHFDLSIFDIYCALKAGATLCLVPSGISYFPVSLADFIERNKITIWYSVPSILVQLVLHGNISSRDWSSLRTIIYAGEVFQFPYLNKLRALLPGVEIVNLYGPTETNVITYYNLKDSPNELTENVPIGRACPYAEILIVGEDNNPVKPGTEGELIVCGDSLMSGYWADNEKTEQSIREIRINNKLCKYYFTGDIVKQRSDGNILYLNRRDNMIKTRGFRVELGEIETTLSKNEAIQEAAVVAVPDDKIGNRIKAAIVMKPNMEKDIEAIKRFCAQFLPAYMVPEIIEFRTFLPKTPNGKIDKKALI